MVGFVLVICLRYKGKKDRCFLFSVWKVVFKNMFQTSIDGEIFRLRIVLAEPVT
jgi:hypothetical protein